MKFGIKLWSTNTELISLCPDAFEDKRFDFIELSAIVGTYNETLLQPIYGIPVLIHIDNNGVDFSERANESRNKAAIKEANAFADFLKAKHIIAHPGYFGSIDYLNNLLENNSNLCIENMPGKTLQHEEITIGRSRADFDKIKYQSFCLDISHAIISAHIFKTDPITFIRDLITLHPVHYHISDGIIGENIDKHLSIGDGNYRFLQIKHFLEPDAWVTLETPKINFQSLEEDLLNIDRLKDRFR